MGWSASDSLLVLAIFGAGLMLYWLLGVDKNKFISRDELELRKLDQERKEYKRKNIQKK